MAKQDIERIEIGGVVMFMQRRGPNLIFAPAIDTQEWRALCRARDREEEPG